MKPKMKIDLETGMAIEPVHPDLSGNDIIETLCPDSLFQPRWNGATWEESLTLSEIEAIKAQAEPSEPTIEERVTATETTVVTLQETIDVIFGGA